MLASPILAVFSFSSCASPAFGGLDEGGGYPEVGVVYFHPDHLMSTVLVTDMEGREVSRVSYLPYGSIDRSNSSGADHFRPKFTTKEWDNIAELYYFGERYYDPVLGRFLEPDPVRQYASPYIYAGNDPEDFIDPDGRAAISITLIVVGAVAGAYAGGAAVNQSQNPLQWDYGSLRTYGGIFAGAAFGAASGSVSAMVAAQGTVMAGVAGVAGHSLLGAAREATFTALDPDAPDEVWRAATKGAIRGAMKGTVQAVGKKKGASFVAKLSTASLAGATGEAAVSALEGGGFQDIGISALRGGTKGAISSFAGETQGFIHGPPEEARRGGAAMLSRLASRALVGSVRNASIAVLYGGDRDSIGRSAAIGAGMSFASGILEERKIHQKPSQAAVFPVQDQEPSEVVRPRARTWP